MGLLGLRVVRNDSSISSRGSGQLAPVTSLLLQKHIMMPSGIFAHQEYIACVELVHLATVNELAGMDDLGDHEQPPPLLKSVWISENYLGEWHTPAWIMNDVLHDALDVA